MCEVKVTLLVPGYTVAGCQDSATGDTAPPVAEPRTDAGLEWLDGQLQMPWEAQLCRQLGLTNEDGKSLPVARFCADRLESGHNIVCAAPIHLKADRDTASLIPPQQLGLDGAEADELIASVNDFLKEDTIELRRDTDFDWFMIGLDGQALKSYPPSFLAHRNASAFLPEGENAGNWRRLMTEIQMLLHTHPVNIRRESAGKLPVNSLWFWGGAALPDLPLAQDPVSGAKTVSVFAEDAYAQSLSKYLGVVCKSLSDFDAALEAGNDVTQYSQNQLSDDIVLVDTSVIDHWLRGDEAGAVEAKMVIDSRWIKTMISQVDQGHCGRFEILTEDGEHGLCNKAVLDEHARQLRAARPSLWKRVLARFQ